MKKIQGLYEQTQNEKFEKGNKVIEVFMVGYNIDIFNNKNRDKITKYHDSWDLLMSVIRKIKSKVFHDGYDMFMPEHYSYISIGNSCYDADLFAAWQGVVKWITLNLDLKDFNFGEINVDDVNLEKNIVYKTKDKEERVYFKISPNVIRRYKQLINYDESVNDICSKISTKSLYSSYLRNGDGKYFIGGNVIVMIDNFKVIAVLKCPTGTMYEKYSKVNNNTIYN